MCLREKLTMGIGSTLLRESCKSSTQGTADVAYLSRMHRVLGSISSTP